MGEGGTSGSMSVALCVGIASTGARWGGVALKANAQRCGRAQVPEGAHTEGWVAYINTVATGSQGTEQLVCRASGRRDLVHEVNSTGQDPHQTPLARHPAVHSRAASHSARNSPRQPIRTSPHDALPQ